MTRIFSPLAVAAVVLLVALITAAPALADGEGPPQPLSGHTAHLLITGIVVAAIVVAAWLALFRIAMAQRRSAARVQPQSARKDQP